jgi:hypothetical protein
MSVTYGKIRNRYFTVIISSIPKVLQIKTQNVKSSIMKCTSMYLTGFTMKYVRIYNGHQLQQQLIGCTFYYPINTTTHILHTGVYLTLLHVPAGHFSHHQVGHWFTKQVKRRGLSLQTVSIKLLSNNNSNLYLTCVQRSFQYNNYYNYFTITSHTLFLWRCISLLLLFWNSVLLDDGWSGQPETCSSIE